LSVSCIFWRWVWLYVCVTVIMCAYVYTHTHTLCTQMWAQGSGGETPREPEESRLTKYWSIHTLICVQNTNVSRHNIHAGRRDEICTNCFFSINISSKREQLKMWAHMDTETLNSTSFEHIDSTLRVLDYFLKIIKAIVFMLFLTCFD